MRWLITVSEQVTPKALQSALAEVKLPFDATQTPTPLDGGDLVYRLEAPDDAAPKLRQVACVRHFNRYSRPDAFSARG